MENGKPVVQHFPYSVQAARSGGSIKTVNHLYETGPFVGSSQFRRAAARTGISLYIDDSVVLESGCVVHPLVFLQGSTVIGRNPAVQRRCEIEDSELGETTFVRLDTQDGLLTTLARSRLLGSSKFPIRAWPFSAG